MLNSLVAPPPCLSWRAGYPQIGNLNRKGCPLALGETGEHSMVNAVSTTKIGYVGRKTACTTCMRTREILPRNKGIDLNELSPGAEWTLFFNTRPRLQQNEQEGAPSTQDSLYPRVSRAEHKTSSATRTAARARDNIL